MGAADFYIGSDINIGLKLDPWLDGDDWYGMYGPECR